MCKLGFKHTEETKRKIREARARQTNLRPKGCFVSEETKIKMRQNHADFSGKNHPSYGEKRTLESRQKMSKAHRGLQVGENNPAWKGGVTPKNVLARTSSQYKKWRTAVFERDNYTCVWCGIPGSKTYLNADYIKPFAFYPELRFVLENGRTLCVPCHKQTNTYANKAKSQAANLK